MLEIVNTDQPFSLDATEIRSILPHGHPFIFVDAAECIDVKSKSISAVKYISQNEPSLSGHFQAFPVFPGVLVIESLAQACGLLAWVIQEKNASSDDTDAQKEQALLVLMETRVRHVGPAFPGDVLKLKASLVSVRSLVHEFNVSAEVGSRKVARGNIFLVKTASAELKRRSDVISPFNSQQSRVLNN